MASAATRRALLAGVPQLVAVAPSAAVLIWAGDRLPDPLASHFGPSGTADAFLGRGALLAIVAALGVGMAVIVGGLGLARMGVPSMPHRDLGRWYVGLAWATAGFLGTVTLLATAANLDLADAADAALPWWTIPLALVVAVAAGALGGHLAPETPPEELPTTVEAAATPLGPTERAVWSRTVTSPTLLVGAGIALAAGAALGAFGQVYPAVCCGIAGLATLALGHARVVVDSRGLTVALGLFGRPRLRVPAEDVAAVATGHIAPLSYGGWGYRLIPGARAVVLRAGPGLIVTRRSGTRLVVTVDDPETAAGLLAGLAARG